ncbi:MAG: ABC transporter permease [Candidatus Aminicenantaceae bacterium]
MENMANNRSVEPKVPVTIIQPKKGWQLFDLKKLIQYRDLFYFLVVRSIKVRYKQTVLGGLWAIIQPFAAMVIFTIFFGRLAKIPSDNVPYPIFSYSAMIAWTYFSTAIRNSGFSLVGSQSLITKVYFPRIIIPIAPVIAGLLDFSIAFVVLIGMMLFYHIHPTALTAVLPLLIIVMVLTASGVGSFLAALNAKYRDIGYTIPFIIQFWLFASPVVYPASMVPERFRMIYALNPMVGVIEGFRSALLGTTAFPFKLILISAVISVFLFLLGAFYFKQMERYFADII